MLEDLIEDRGREGVIQLSEEVGASAAPRQPRCGSGNDPGDQAMPVNVPGTPDHLRMQVRGGLGGVAGAWPVGSMANGRRPAYTAAPERRIRA